jgi:hypothetical protein
MNSSVSQFSNSDDFNDWRFDGPSAEALARATGAVERLDEQVKRSAVGTAWRARVLYAEACAGQLAEGRLVHEDELVGADCGLRLQPGFIELADTLAMLRVWRAALDADAYDSLRGERPGIAPDAAHPFPAFRRPMQPSGVMTEAGARDDIATDPHKLESWRRTWRQSKAVSPVLAAAIVWDCWRELTPEPGSAWRGGLLAAMVLRQRGLTPNLLVPVSLGWKVAPYRITPAHAPFERVMGIVSWIEAAALQGQKDLANLGLAYMHLRRSMRARRRHSRLPALAKLFMALPVVTVPLAARHLGCSPQAIEKMIPMLGGTARLISEGPRFRAWTAP